mmetsp:Transcript_33967/g.73444  ORF Transcript_33967/g.73444 Transcript_33967/m.73444 type:complete len:273 (-) Transcript_33967:209-1027(-)|eukprot:CAMPEP_0206426096 /NCGR_PEP_ID=MMETSP0324_2-20121206/4176_1 /ASSEMBLY_ACC=CAM_ASM_000836 /TAXON_ID=2866 /ORGANISM="Crypthecodinium cohnii, Strain Seligo" /LENGTH=272 /DNA_ID=CAMNT_0053890989 /DNA_START=202 /DNA_END=1020 /DNA_ORIENTATION=-
MSLDGPGPHRTRGTRLTVLEQHLKTRICKFWLEGKCLRDQCLFAHGEEELRAPPDLSRTVLCRQFAKYGFCVRENCMFAHESQVVEKGDTDTAYKTRLCNFAFAEGQLCRFGDQCRQAHSVAELRPTPDQHEHEKLSGHQPLVDSAAAASSGLSRSSGSLPETVHPQQQQHRGHASRLNKQPTFHPNAEQGVVELEVSVEPAATEFEDERTVPQPQTMTMEGSRSSTHREACLAAPSATQVPSSTLVQHSSNKIHHHRKSEQVFSSSSESIE